MPASHDQTGHTLLVDCNTSVNNNAGYGVTDFRRNPYGPSFNDNEGGWYGFGFSLGMVFCPVKSGTATARSTDQHLGELIARDCRVRSQTFNPLFFFVGFTYCALPQPVMLCQWKVHVRQCYHQLGALW